MNVWFATRCQPNRFSSGLTIATNVTRLTVNSATIVMNITAKPGHLPKAAASSA